MKNIKKRTKIIAIASIVLVVVVLGYLTVTQRFSADTSSVTLADNQLTADSIVDNNIKGRTLSASALPTKANPYSDSIAFTGAEDLTIGLINDALQTDCIKLFYEKYSPSDITKDIDASNFIKIGECNYAVSDFKKNDKLKNSSFTLSGFQTYKNESEVIIPSAYKSETELNNGEEAETSNSSINIQFKFNVKSSNSKWEEYVNKTTSMNISGSFYNNYILDMDAEEDLMKSAQVIKDPRYKGVDIKNSTWKIKTSGKVMLAVGGDFELKDFTRFSDNFKTNELYQAMDIKKSIKLKYLDFCLDGCQILVSEELNLKTNKNDTTSKGLVTSKALHTEKYTGKGGSDLTAKTIFWDSLVLEKNDNRSWDQDLTYANGKMVKYTGSIDTKGILQPLIKDKMDINSTVKRDVTISDKSTSKVMIQTKNKANVFKKETNVDGEITRTGTSYSSDCYGENPCIEKNGIFDNTSSDTVKLTSPANMAGQRVSDPFFSSSITPYTKTIYDVGSIYVPGLFTASYKYDNNIATIATRSVKLLPKKLYVFKSNDPKDPLFDTKYIVPLKSWIKALNKKGIKVETIDTSTPEKLKNAFSKVEPGSWIFNYGHGAPDGLVVGQKNFVSYAEIQKLIKDKGVKIDVFAGLTCYIGRSGIGRTTIGSIMPMIGSFSASLGNVIGIGGNTVNMTTTDLTNALNKIVETVKSPQNPAVTPSVSLPIKPSTTPVVSPKVTLPPTTLVSPKISPTVSLPIMPSTVPNVTPKVTLPPMPSTVPTTTPKVSLPPMLPTR